MSIPDHLKKLVSNLPDNPGIYKFFDKKGRLLYIGKSKNLKKRISSYFSKQNEQIHERTLRLIFHIHQIEIIKTNTELEALILEDNLIKQHLPQYNIKQKKFKEQAYLVISSDKFPTIKIITNEEVECFELIYIPFKGKFAAEKILHTLQNILKIRKCKDRVPKRKCIQYEFGKCIGPCRGKISSTEYQKVINKAIDFLNGDPKSISLILREKIKEISNSLKFEEAIQLRDALKFCRRFCKRQKFISRFISGNLIISEKVRKRIYIFQHGELIKISNKKLSDKIIQQCFKSKKRTNIINNNHLLDRAFVVWVWITKNNCSYKFIVKDIE